SAQVIGRDSSELAKRSSVAGQERRSDMKASRVQLVRQIAKRLRCIAASMKKQHGRSARSHELEAFATDDDPVRSASTRSHDSRVHRSKLPRKPPGARRDNKR